MNMLAQLSTNTDPEKYLSTIASLTRKESGSFSGVSDVVSHTPLALLFSPYLVYGSVALFLIVFLAIILVQFFHRAFDYRRTLTGFVVALLIAVMPVSLKTALEVTTLQSKAGPDEVPRQIVISPQTPASVLVTWKTEAEKTGAIRFGTAPLSPQNYEVVIADQGKSTRTHSAELKKLQKGKAYELEILSGKDWYNDQGQPIQFTFAP